MSIRASAPGKLMLVGEHAVVYNHPCIVTAVDIRYSSEISILDEEDRIIRIHTDRPDQDGKVREVPLDSVGSSFERETSFVEAVVARIYKEHQLKQSIAITTDGPELSYGLGSSSAVTASTAVALNELFNLGLNKRQLFDLCYKAVLDVQDKGSGFDVAAALYGGTLYFSTGGNTIEPLSISELPLVIGYSGKKVGTVSLVKQVSELRTSHPSIIDGLFALIHELVDEAKDLLLKANWSSLGDLLDINQGLLDALGVNTCSLAELVFAARDAGSLGAKLSGAGGGDCMYALVSPAQRGLTEMAIVQAGGLIVPHGTNVRGAYIE